MRVNWNHWLESTWGSMNLYAGNFWIVDYVIISKIILADTIDSIESENLCKYYTWRVVDSWGNVSQWRVPVKHTFLKDSGLGEVGCLIKVNVFVDQVNVRVFVDFKCQICITWGINCLIGTLRYGTFSELITLDSAGQLIMRPYRSCVYCSNAGPSFHLFLKEIRRKPLQRQQIWHKCNRYFYTRVH